MYFTELFTIHVISLNQDYQLRLETQVTSYIFFKNLFHFIFSEMVTIHDPIIHLFIPSFDLLLVMYYVLSHKFHSYISLTFLNID